MGNTEQELRFVGRGFHDWYQGAVSEDQPTRIAAMRGFVHSCLAGEIDRGDLETMIAFNCMTPQFTSLAYHHTQGDRLHARSSASSISRSLRPTA